MITNRAANLRPGLIKKSLDYNYLQGKNIEANFPFSNTDNFNNNICVKEKKKLNCKHFYSNFQQ